MMNQPLTSHHTLNSTLTYMPNIPLTVITHMDHLYPMMIMAVETMLVMAFTTKTEISTINTNYLVSIIILFIEFIYFHDRFRPKCITYRITKYGPLLRDIVNRGWTVAPLIVCTAGACRTIHDYIKYILLTNYISKSISI